MHFRRADLLMGLIGFILVVVSSYQLIFVQRNNSGTGIALLEMIQQTVKTRQGSDLFWTTPSQGSAIQDNQLIFTAQGSSARISFKDGNIIEVNENSLVRIKESNLNLVKGEFKTQLSGKDLEIQVGDQKLKLKSDQAQVAIQKAGDKTLIGVVSGNVDVIDQEQNVVKASSTNIVEVGEGKVQVKDRMDIEPQPAVAERFYTTEERLKVPFGQYPGRILISQSKNLKNARTLKKDEALAPGTYYWRVISQTHESLIYHFEIVKDTPPKIFRPNHQSVIKTTLPTVLNLQWEVTGLDSEVEVVANETLIREVMKGSLYSIKLANEGDYRWRVRKQYPDHKDATWTSWLELKVIDLAKDIPMNLLPVDYEVQTYDLDSEKVDFTWDYPGEVTVSVRHQSGSTETFKAKDKFSWKVSGEGEFFVKVKALDNPLDHWTKESRVWVKDLSKEKNLEVYTVELKRPDQDVNFSWKEASEKGEYLFELSRTQDFKEIILSRKVKDADIKVSIPEVGAYYWRSRVLTNGKWRASPPKRVIIKPTPAPARPKSLPELKLPLKLKKQTSHFQLVPSAFADESTFVTIKLPANEDAKFYKIEIYKDEKLSQRIFTKTSPKNQITWTGARSGKFYYRYSIIDHWQRESEFSDPSILEITTEHLRPGSPNDLKLTVKEKSVIVDWQKDKLASFYRLEIANNKDFTNAKVINTPNNQHQFNVDSGRYYLRVKSLNDFGESSYLEKNFKISFKNNSFKEADKNHLFALYRPSMDTMEFTDDQSGKVDGNVTGAIEFRYERLDQYLSILKADLVTGKVFEGESYQQYSLEGSLDYLFLNDEWKISLGPVVKWWSLPSFSIEDKVVAQSESHFTAGAHARVGTSIGQQDLIFDQYVFATGVTGLVSELSYRRNMERINLFVGAAFESIEFQEQKKNSIILKAGLGLSF